MDKTIVKLTFPEMLEKISQGVCPTCGLEVNPLKFKNESNIIEYERSGMCQVCQDEIFRE